MADPFAPGGALAQALPGYEHRPQQTVMARQVADTLQKGGVALIEAGTGTGKSLAYLIPAAQAAMRSGRPVVISTQTINLQEQLIHKDIPLVRKAKLPNLKAVLVKGWSNYLCLQRYQAAVTNSGDLLEPGEELQLDAIREWVVRGPSEGSRHELPFTPAPAVWEQVAAESDTCTRQACPFYDRCYLFEARRQTEGAHLLVVNHHLLFADFAVRRQVGWETEHAVLPRYDHVVLDEAHHLEDVATDHLGYRLAQGGWRQFLSRIARSSRGGKLRGTLPALHKRLNLEDGKQANRLIRLIDDTIYPTLRLAHDMGDHFFASVRKWLAAQKGAPYGELAPFQAPITVDDLWEGQIQPAAERLVHTLATLRGALDDLAETLRSLDSDWTAAAQEIEALSARAANVMQGVEQLAGAEDPRHVYWVEGRTVRQGEYRVTLFAAPIEIGPDLRHWLQEGLDSLVCSSATLAVGNRFDYIRERLGLAESPSEVAELNLPSPFAYEEQAALFVPSDVCDPTEPNYPESLSTGLARLLVAAEGSAFVLFTSYALLKQVRQRIGPALDAAGIPLLVHGEAPRHLLLERFAHRPGSVLLGTDSFWEGVDVVGDALSLVVIARLPFEVPNHPVAQARARRLEETGKNPFYNYTLPRAALRLKQGVGRLIRSGSDRGAIVIYDGRIVRRDYGRLLLSSLPPAPLHVTPHDELVDQVASQLSSSMPVIGGES